MIWRIIFGLCPHSRLGFPLRHDDGRDWQTCTECGSKQLAKVQFRSSVRFLRTPVPAPVVRGAVLGMSRPHEVARLVRVK